MKPTPEMLKKALALYKTKARRNMFGEPIRPIKIAPSPEDIAQALADEHEAAIRECAEIVGTPHSNQRDEEFDRGYEAALANRKQRILALLETK